MSEFKVRGRVTKTTDLEHSIHGGVFYGFHVVESTETASVCNPVRLDVVTQGELARTCAEWVAVDRLVEVGGHLGRREMRRGRLRWPSFSAVATSVHSLDPAPEQIAMARVVHCKQDDYDFYIGRGRDPRNGEPGVFPNPYSHKASKFPGVIRVGSAQEAVDCFEAWFWQQIKAGKVDLRLLASLHGKTYGCWCMGPCHGSVIARAAAWAHRRLVEAA